jgi:hypothetical protein
MVKGKEAIDDVKDVVVKFLSPRKVRQFKNRGWVRFQIKGCVYEIRGKDKIEYKISKLEKQIKKLKQERNK